jgi:hypothetical protein
LERVNQIERVSIQDSEITDIANETITQKINDMSLAQFIEKTIPRKNNRVFSATQFTDIFSNQLDGSTKKLLEEISADVQGISLSEYRAKKSIVFSALYTNPSGMVAQGALISPDFKHYSDFAGRVPDKEIAKLSQGLHELIDDLVVGIFQEIDLDDLDQSKKTEISKLVKSICTKIVQAEADRNNITNLLASDTLMGQNYKYLSTPDTAGQSRLGKWHNDLDTLQLDGKLLSAQIKDLGGDGDKFSTWIDTFVSIQQSEIKTDF